MTSSTSTAAKSEERGSSELARPQGPRKFHLESPLEPRGDQPQAIRKLVEGIRQEQPYQTLLGVTGSGKTFTMAHVVEALQRPTLVISPNKTLAAQLVSEFRDVFPQNAVEYFVSYYDYYQPEAYVPQIDLYVEKDASVNEEIDRLRHRATQALLSRRDVLIVASVSCIYGLGSPEDYRAQVLTLKKGETWGRRELLQKLVSMRYQRNDMELKRGRFRVRGSTIDLMGAAESGHRLLFDGDVLQEILEFDPTSGEDRAPVEELQVFPATHFLTPQESLEDALKEIEKELGARYAELQEGGKALEAQRLKSRTEYDLEMIREVGYCNGIENYSRHLTRRAPGESPYTLMDFFPKDALIFVDESHVTLPQIRGMYEGDKSRKDNLVEFGWRLPSCRDNRPLKWPEFLARAHQMVFVSATPGPIEHRLSGPNVAEQIIRPTGLVDPPVEVRPIKGHMADLVAELRARVEKEQRCLVTTLTKSTAEELANYLSGLHLKVRYLHSDVETLKRVEILRDLRLGQFDILVGINLLREGLDLPEVSLVAILDADKEGYLRSETSLIQTAGRASRNLDGKVILYADRVTGSMSRAMAETGRRRELQLAYNREHGVVPATIVKEVHSLLAEEEAASGELSTSGLGKKWKERLPLLMANLEEEMRLAADRLEFEKAARIRDKIRSLQREAGLRPR
ncbi:MAG: excinuclease ABC subunit UvrB [Euryarchaeota archaeon]|nr:excinuclease ABC subunit UvrB [Euryarchaeota archaeon]MDE1836975.1 excinuclease ABC subunit UvrB [Euryarchaeota archaeon]MDE1880795.1 excinuclease ABC subunit UvrB [Euryarchaeota archaeon]MDE2045840.1 excinuclease ABC subunit UvrB [Thermoplasmata archaeon]